MFNLSWEYQPAMGLIHNIVDYDARLKGITYDVI